MTSKQGGRHYGLDTIEHRNSDNFLGNPLPSSYLERTEPHYPASRVSTRTHLLGKASYPMLADTVLNLPIETVNCGTLAPTYNPILLAVVTLHEWQTFTQQCKAHPAVSPAFPSLTIKVEGRSLDLYLEEDGQKPENIGMLYMETYSEQTAIEFEEAIEKGLIHPMALESEKLMADDAFMAVYYEWFEDTALFEPHKWEAIGKALHHRITTIPTSIPRSPDQVRWPSSS